MRLTWTHLYYPGQKVLARFTEFGLTYELAVAMLHPVYRNTIIAHYRMSR